MSPGRAGPSEADTVTRTPIRTVLLVDQLEEVFAPGVTAEHRAAYLDTLVRRGGGGELVVALRADRTPELVRGARARPPPGARLVPAQRHGRRRAAHRDRASGPAGGAPGRTRPGRPPAPRGPGRTRRPPAAVALAGGDVEPARGADPHRRRLPRQRGCPWLDRPVRRDRVRRRTARAARPAPRPADAAGGPRSPRASRRGSGSRATASSPAPSRSGWSSCSSARDCSPATTATSPWPTRPWPASGPGCAGGSTTTSRANGSVTTCPPARTPGRPWADRTASSTEASGWPGRSSGAPTRAPPSPRASGSSSRRPPTTPRPSSRASSSEHVRRPG